MAKPSLMNLHILILILLNGHKISCPQQQLDTVALSQCLNTFLSFSETDTEKSEFCSIEVLDETADSKATVLKTLKKSMCQSP
jgi:hypothetical protein